jgi:hypothetical protein
MSTSSRVHAGVCSSRKWLGGKPSRSERKLSATIDGLAMPVSRALT